MKRWDSESSFFLIDPPWFKSFYDQPFAYFNRRSVKQYDEEIIKICKEMKGKFIITSRKENTVMKKSGFNNYLVRSIYVVSGKYPDVMLTTNLNLDKNKLVRSVDHGNKV